MTEAIGNSMPPTAKHTTRRRVGRPTGDTNLREALVNAALAVLEEERDPAAVTVQAIVERADCTPPSLYHYWPTRDHLLIEAGNRGWQEFQTSQSLAVSADGAEDPLDRIRRRGGAYLAFALDRPSLFRVLFLDRRVPGTTAAKTESPGPVLADLIADVTEAINTNVLRKTDPMAAALALWSAVHGLAALWVASPDLPHELAWRAALLQQNAIIAGLAPRAT